MGGQQGLGHSHYSQRKGTSQREERGCGGRGEGCWGGERKRRGIKSDLGTTRREWRWRTGGERTQGKWGGWDWKLRFGGGEWKWRAGGWW